MTQNETNKDILRIVDLLELQIKICNCHSNIKYEMLDKIDRIHSTIHNMECEPVETKEDSIHFVNVKYELDKEAYRQYIAEMKEIEAKFKADNGIVVGVAGEKLEEGDIVYDKSDGKFYKSDDGKFYKSDDGKFYKSDDNDTTEHIPATLKDVCEWWIKEYPEHVLYYKTENHKSPMDTSYDKTRRHMKKILKNI